MKKIALLAGGLSSEREVSFSSAKGVEEALKKLGYEVVTVDADRDLAQKLVDIKPNLVFNALHGTYGEDGCVQGLLEILQIPYTHSGVEASAVAMNKQLTKQILQNVGVNCIPGQEITKEQIANGDILFDAPYVIKPLAEGSSVGIFIVNSDGDIPKMSDLERFDKLMVEKYIPGRELSVAVTDDEAMGVVELRPKDGYYDYEHKYTDGKTEHIMPAPIDKKIYDEAMEAAYFAHKILGCAGLSRSDFRYDEDGDGKLYFMEINTHPGLTPLSLAPEIAAYKGMSYKDLVEYLVGKARCWKD